jgi:hypothetical protein
MSPEGATLESVAPSGLMGLDGSVVPGASAPGYSRSPLQGYFFPLSVAATVS